MHSTLRAHFSESISVTIRQRVGFLHQRLFETPVIWVHFVRRSERVADWKHETPTPDYALGSKMTMVFNKWKHSAELESSYFFA